MIAGVNTDCIHPAVHPAANRAGGWSVLVGARMRSVATHTLAGTGAVHDWLLANAATGAPPEATTR